MIEQPPRRDFVVRTLATRTAGTLPLMAAELVIASGRTRATHPLAERYPLHFRKTYYPGRLHADPSVEFDHHMLASTLIPVPPPIGCDRNTFRSCLLPGRPLDQVCELGTEPDASNIAVARAMPLTAAVGLWYLAEQALAQLAHMQSQGLTHGDAHLHNFIVCSSPAEVFPIDFERALVQQDVSEQRWRERCDADRHHLLRLAVFLQAALGRQRGPLAEEANARMDTLVTPADTFRRAITERTHAGAT